MLCCTKKQCEVPGSPPATPLGAGILPSLQLLRSIVSWMVVAHVQVPDPGLSGAQSRGQRRAAVSGDQAVGQPTHTHTHSHQKLLLNSDLCVLS